MTSRILQYAYKYTGKMNYSYAHGTRVRTRVLLEQREMVDHFPLTRVYSRYYRYISSIRTYSNRPAFDVLTTYVRSWYSSTYSSTPGTTGISRVRTRILEYGTYSSTLDVLECALKYAPVALRLAAGKNMSSII